MASRNYLLIYILLFFVTLIISCSNQSSVRNANLYTTHNIIADTIKLQQNARYFYINGVNYQINNKDAEAIIEFQEAIQYDNNPTIYYAMAKSYYNLFKIDRALQNLKKALELDPKHLPSLDMISDILYYSDINSAIKYNELAMDIDDNIGRKFKQAVMYENIDTTKSIELYNEIIKINPENTIVLEKLSNIYYNQGNYDKALESLHSLDNIEINEISSINKIITIYIKENKYNEAFNFLKSKQFKLSDREFENICYEFGLLLDSPSSNNNSIIMNNYLDYIQSEFRFSNDFLMLGAFLSSKYNTSLLSSFIDRALKSTDSLAKTLSISLNLYNTINDTLNIYKLIQQYNDTINKDLNLILLVSYIYSINDKDSIALEYLEKGIKIDSNNADIYSQMGFLYDKMKLVEKSDNMYQLSLALDPYNPNTNNNYAYSLCERNIKLNDALAMSQKVIDSDIQLSAFYDTYAWINYKLGKVDIALEYLMKAVNLSDVNSETYEHLGIVQLANLQIENAKLSFQKALEMNPNNNIAKEKLEILNK